MGINIKSIEDNQPKTDSKNLLLRYAYLEILENAAKDVNFFYETNEERKKEIYDRKIDFDEEINEVICKTVIEALSRFCDDNGIEYSVEISELKYGKQHYAIIVTGDQEKKYFIDPMTDIFLVQMRMKTVKFGKIRINNEVSVFSDEEIKEMDDELGYTYLGMYMDEVIAMMNDEFFDVGKKSTIRELIEAERKENAKPSSDVASNEQNKALKRDDYTTFKLKFLLKYFNQIPKLRGYIEQKCFYDLIIDEFFTKPEKRNLKRNTICRRDNDGKITEMKAYITHQKADGTYEYYILEPHNGEPFQKVAILDEYMLENGWQFIKDKKGVTRHRNRSSPEK